MIFLHVLCMLLLQIAATEVHTSTSSIFRNIDDRNESEDSAATILQLAINNIRKRTGSQQNRPFVTVAYAQTLDGSIAPRERSRLDISSKISFQLLHSLRACHDAVLIGVNTLAVDAPRLNVRDPLFGNTSTHNCSNSYIVSPRPVVIDSSLRCSEIPSIHLSRPIVCSSFLNCRKHLESSSQEQDQRLQKWKGAEMKIKSLGGDLVRCIADSDDRCDLADCLRLLKMDFKVNSLLVEGGATVLQSCLEQRVVDQAVVTIRPCFLGGYNSLVRQLAKPVSLRDVVAASVGGDIILHGVLRGEHGAEIHFSDYRPRARLLEDTQRSFSEK